MSLTVKAIFKEEIRRINVDSTSASSYDYLEGKIRAGFPNLPPKEKTLLKWKDADGDLVTFSSDEELLEALSSADNGILRIYIEKRVSTGRGWPHENPAMLNDIQDFVGQLGAGLGNMPFAVNQVHHGVTCDNCDTNNIQGTRFKCMECEDYDLCATCKSLNTIHTEHKFREIKVPQAPFGRWASWGAGRGKCTRGGKRNMNESSDEDNRRNKEMPFETRQKVKEVVQLVREAAKSRAFALGGAVAGDCTGATVEIAVRSSIRRALLVQKTTGCGSKRSKKDKKHQSDSSSSSSEDSDIEVVDKVSDASGKGLKKRVKVAIKETVQITKKEVNDRFGKMAANWAAHAVRQSMKASIMKSIKAEKKREQPSVSRINEEPMNEDSASVNSRSESIAPSAPTATTAQSPESVYPEIGSFVVMEAPPVPAPVVAKPNEEDEAIAKAVRAFQDMGFKEDDWLMTKIIEKKGNIPQVFESLRNENH